LLGFSIPAELFDGFCGTDRIFQGFIRNLQFAGGFEKAFLSNDVFPI
jgi:hypothetical protein